MADGIVPTPSMRGEVWARFRDRELFDWFVDWLNGQGLRSLERGNAVRIKAEVDADGFATLELTEYATETAVPELPEEAPSG